MTADRNHEQAFILISRDAFIHFSLSSYCEICENISLLVSTVEQLQMDFK